MRLFEALRPYKLEIDELKARGSRALERMTELEHLSDDYKTVRGCW